MVTMKNRCISDCVTRINRSFKKMADISTTLGYVREDEEPNHKLHHLLPDTGNVPYLLRSISLPWSTHELLDILIH